MTPEDARRCWEQWLDAVAANRPVTAKACAETLLDVIAHADVIPRWTPAEQRAFLNWCDAEGLLLRNRV